MAPGATRCRARGCHTVRADPSQAGCRSQPSPPGSPRLIAPTRSSPRRVAAADGRVADHIVSPAGAAANAATQLPSRTTPGKVELTGTRPGGARNSRVTPASATPTVISTCTEPSTVVPLFNAAWIGDSCITPGARNANG